MPRKIKQYTNPFLKANAQLVSTVSSVFPTLKDAIALHQQGQLEQAKGIYVRLLEIDPKNADALHLLGVIAHQSGNHQVAVDLIGQAIEINSSVATYHSNRGNALKRLQHLDAAVANYDKAIALKPDFAEAYYNRGNALKEQKQFDSSISSYDKAIALKPEYAEAYSNRGASLKELKQLDAAVASFEKAIAIKIDFAEAYSNRGNVLREMKQLVAAIADYDKAISIKPENAEAFSNRGVSHQELKQLDAALSDYDKASALRPDYAQAYANRGSVFQELKQLDAAVADFDIALSLKPNYEYLFGIRQHAKMLMCDWHDFENNISQLRRKIQNKEKAATCFPTLALPFSLSEQHQVAKILSAAKHSYDPSLGPILRSPRKTKIRIGYYSADFHNHATAYLMAELFELHDKFKFELIAFSYGPDKNDGMRTRLFQAFDRFIDVTKISDKGVAQLSRELGIDIAVDLKGLTQDARFGIFSYKAAPIQVSYLGYPGTLGTEYIDYLIADKTLIPAGSQQYYSEYIAYLPNSYQVNDRKRALAPTLFTKKELGLPQEAFVFVSFNNNYKIIPSVFDTWVRVLKAVDTSVLWLLEDNATAAINLRKEAALRGLDPARLVFATRMDLSAHLARHRAADLFLDTLPYNAHTTASDALWAGLPVLTCMGEGFASRVSASLLYAIGLPELVTETLADYESLAIELATNQVKLKGIKEKLKSNRLTAPLFDTTLFSKHIEAAYSQMYERYQSDLPIDHIYITS